MAIRWKGFEFDTIGEALIFANEIGVIEKREGKKEQKAEPKVEQVTTAFEKPIKMRKSWSRRSIWSKEELMIVGKELAKLMKKNGSFPQGYIPKLLNSGVVDKLNNKSKDQLTFLMGNHRNEMHKIARKLSGNPHSPDSFNPENYSRKKFMEWKVKQIMETNPKASIEFAMAQAAQEFEANGLKFKKMKVYVGELDKYNQESEGVETHIPQEAAESQTAETVTIQDVEEVKKPEFPVIFPLTEDATITFEQMLRDLIQRGDRGYINLFSVSGTLELVNGYQWAGRIWREFCNQFMLNINKVCEALGCDKKKLRVSLNNGYHTIIYR